MERVDKSRLSVEEVGELALNHIKWIHKLAMNEPRVLTYVLEARQAPCREGDVLKSVPENAITLKKFRRMKTNVPMQR